MPVKMILNPIATVRSCFGEKFAVPRQPGLCPSAWGRLIFHPQFRIQEAVRGIDGFSHLWLIFGFHDSQKQGWRPTVRPPRLGGNQRVGIFASRSTFRPNGLGLSLVKLEGVDTSCVDSPVLLLGGLDLIDGTPVYDIKPYLSYAEALPDAAAGFACDPITRIGVEVGLEATDDFERLPARAKSVILESLALDPRPATHSVDGSHLFGASLCGCNVRFTIDEGICRISEITPADDSGLSGPNDFANSLFD